MRRVVPREVPAAVLAVLAGISLLVGLELRWTSQLSPVHAADELVALVLIGAGTIRLMREVPRFSAIASAILLPVAMLFAIGVIVPVRLNTYVSTEYWMAVAFHDVFARGMHFGSDVAFTYGPWGFVLLEGFHPKTVVLMFLLRTIIAIIGLLAFSKLVEPRGFAVLLIAALAVIVHICGGDTFFELLPLITLFYAFARARDPKIYFPLIVAGGLLSLAKFPFLLMMTVVVAVVTVDELRRRARPWTVVCYAIAVAAFWLLARQRAVDFLPFLRTSFELAAGYGEAMARDASEYAPHTLLPFLISALAFSIVIALFERRRGILLLVAWTAVLLLLFKGAFVRADRLHVAPACGALLLIELAYVAARARGRAVLALIVPVAFWLFPIERFANGGVVHDVVSMVRESATNVRRMVNWPRFRDDMNRIHAAAIAVTPVPPPNLHADIYPMPCGIVARKGFTYQPRPLFVSYAVYTPRLLELNANWLRSTPPPTVLFDTYTIDRRLPSMQDGMSWPILLTQYSVAGRLWRNVILERRAAPLAATLTPILARRARFGEKVPLPPQTNGLLFARLTIDLTRGGRVASMLYKVPRLSIRVGLDDGTEKTFRFVRGIGAREFLLSPFVEDPDTFATLFTRDTTKWRRVVWFAIEPKTPTSAYEPSYRVELLQL